MKFVCHTDERKYIEGTEIPAKIPSRLKNASSDEERAQIENSAAEMQKNTIKIDDVVANGDILPYANTEIILTPGHTPGHICLYIPDEKLLVTGDAMNLGKDGTLMGPNPIHTMDMALATASLERLREFDIKKVLCYHGGLFEGDFSTALYTILHP